MEIIRTDKSVLNRWWWSIDRLSLYAVFALVVSGIILVLAASPSVAERIGLNSFYFATRQIMFLIPTIIIMFGMSLISRKNLWRVSSLVTVVSIILMIALMVIGFHTKGATRWISMFGFSLQPSEFVKPAFAVSAAWLMSKRQYEKGFPGYKISLGTFFVIVSLLLMQPDIGMSFVISSILGAQLFVSGISWIIIALMLSFGVLVGLVLYLVFPHFESRFDRFINPAVGDTYQVEKSIDAFINGGLWGRGPGHGEVKMHLPDAHSDFIFSVAGEEFGMIAVTFIIALYVFIIVRSVQRVYKHDDMFVILATTGLATQLGVQSLIHMGSSLQLLPAKGMTLPLISYGGSSLVSCGFAVGMLLALTSKRIQAEFSVENRRSII